MRPSAFAIPILLLAGCASTQYRYDPSQFVSNAQSPTKGASYSLITENGQAQVDIASYGVTDDGMMRVGISVTRPPAEKGQASPGNWKLSSRDQMLVFPNGQRIAPSYAGTPKSGLPDIQIAPGQKSAIELYYPLPQEMKGADKIPRFVLDWRVETPERPLTASTTFDRVAIYNGPPPYYYGYYSGPPWYWNGWSGWGYPGWW